MQVARWCLALALPSMHCTVGTVPLNLQLPYLLSACNTAYGSMSWPINGHRSLPARVHAQALTQI